MAQLTLPGVGRLNIIDDSNYLKYADDPGTREVRGLQPRNYSKHPFGSMPWGTMPFPVIPRSEWADRIDEGHAKKTFPIYHQLRKKTPILNQKRLPYCWMYAVTGAVQSIRACAGFPTAHLSATSAGAPGKNYREEGGWTGEAIGYAKKYGIASIETWPEAVNDRRYFRESRDEAKLYNVGQWFELRPKNFDEVMTCLLLGYPVCVGLLWWGHAVFYPAPIRDRSDFGVIDDNSWGPEWEENGRSVLMESKATPDEANVITSPKMAGDGDVEQRHSAFYDLLTAG